MPPDDTDEHKRSAWKLLDQGDAPRQAWVVFGMEKGPETDDPDLLDKWWDAQIRDLVDRANRGQVAAAKLLLDLAIAELSDPHHRPTWEMTQWLLGILRSIRSTPRSPAGLLISPRPKGGRRPKFADNLDARVRFEFMTVLAIMEANQAFQRGEKADAAFQEAAEWLRQSGDYASPTTGKPYTKDDVRSWYYAYYAAIGVTPTKTRAESDSSNDR
jgi:hypothetical protein